MTLTELITAKKTIFQEREAARKAKEQVREYIVETLKRNYDRHVMDIAEAMFYEASVDECAEALLETMRNEIVLYLCEKLFNPSEDSLAEYLTDAYLYNASMEAFGDDLKNNTDNDVIRFGNIFRRAFRNVATD